jgi:hypothetical protein
MFLRVRERLTAYSSASFDKEAIGGIERLKSL